MKEISFPKLIIATLAVTSLVFFLSFKWVNNQWRYNIASDGKGYYIYLPAAFIYHDFSYEFTNQTELQHYSGDIQPPVATLSNGEKLNKYFVGEAMLLLPFFLIAYLLSIICGAAVDGYGFVFQAMVSVAALFYALAGLWQMKRLLQRFQVSENIIALVLLLLFAGTNLLHYTLMEPSMSHVYSFFAITSFLAVTGDYCIHKKAIQLFTMASLLGIICLIRPVNVLVVLTVPFIGFMLNKQVLSPFSKLSLTYVVAACVFLCIVFIQLLMYKLQVGEWLVWAYVDEGFNFRNPHFFDFLCSFRKGWLVYTPVCAVSLLAAFYVWRKNLVLLGAFFIPLVMIVYVLSSWHDWAYGASLGSRPMVDFSGYAIMPLALCFNQIKSYTYKLLLVLSVWCMLLLNIIQTYQINKYILLWDEMTFDAYKASFLKTHERYVHMLD
jgi:hypothetical protein